MRCKSEKNELTRIRSAASRLEYPAATYSRCSACAASRFWGRRLLPAKRACWWKLEWMPWSLKAPRRARIAELSRSLSKRRWFQRLIWHKRSRPSPRRLLLAASWMAGIWQPCWRMALSPPSLALRFRPAPNRADRRPTSRRSCVLRATVRRAALPRFRGHFRSARRAVCPRIHWPPRRQQERDITLSAAKRAYEADACGCGRAR